MARYTGPVCRLCRREGEKLFLKGERCYSDKCSVAVRAYAPGQHGQGRKKNSEYATQFRMKQKAKRFYGLSESQFHKYFVEAERRQGMTGANLLQILESRLDNVVYRLGFASSRNEARQLVLHNHFELNGKKVNIPSILLKAGDTITIKSGSLQSEKIKAVLETNGSRPTPNWLERIGDGKAGKVVSLPTREEIDAPVEESLIVELYSK
ncbi:MAG: 30S ribosomal protein S4 [Acutalibacteraceae bacterium]|nr:30S ribosomal protein S4 [Acutalibacteraceae bacterium]